ncbi:MAG TPA: hypothetical protein VIM31_01630 [Candidatus Microsaccharimonas sp.]|jgi:hypothetical protein
MSETVEIGLKQWENSSSDELGFTSPDVTRKTTRFINDKGQQFNVVDVDARNGQPGPTVLTSMSFDFRAQPLYEARMATIGTQLQARVISSEIPGITINLDDPDHTRGDFQTPHQTAMALFGDFDPLAEEQFKAMYEVGELSDDDEYQFLGGSLGAYSVVAMARAMANGKLFGKNFNVTRMDLIEPVNAYGNYTILRQGKILYNLATTEDQRRQVYLAENAARGYGDSGKAFEKISPYTLKQDKYVKGRQVLATYATGIGLRKGLHAALEDALERAPDLRGTDIALYRAKDSTVSFEADLQSASQTIRDNGGQAEAFTLVGEVGDATPIGHHVLDSHDRNASFARALQLRAT